MCRLSWNLELLCSSVLFCFENERLTGIAQSVQRLAIGWTVRGSNPGGARFSATVQTGPWAHPASFTMGTGSLSRGQSGRGWRWPPTISSAEVKERVQLYLYPRSGYSWPVLRWTLSLALPFKRKDKYFNIHITDSRITVMEVRLINLSYEPNFKMGTFWGGGYRNLMNRLNLLAPEFYI
jgi:hypothetical protein